MNENLTLPRRLTREQFEALDDETRALLVELEEQTQEQERDHGRDQDR
jgi:hypothetical protein